MSMRIPALVGILIWSGMAVESAAQEYYRWVDSDGVVHFSQQPPPDQTEAQRGVLVPPPRPGGNSAPATRPAPETADEQDADADLPNAYGKDPEMCARVVENLNTIRDNARIAIQDPDTGEASFLSEQQRATEVARLENMRDYYCE